MRQNKEIQIQIADKIYQTINTLGNKNPERVKSALDLLVSSFSEKNNLTENKDISIFEVAMPIVWQTIQQLQNHYQKYNIEEEKITNLNSSLTSLKKLFNKSGNLVTTEPPTIILDQGLGNGETGDGYGDSHNAFSCGNFESRPLDWGNLGIITSLKPYNGQKWLARENVQEKAIPTFTNRAWQNLQMDVKDLASFQTLTRQVSFDGQGQAKIDIPDNYEVISISCPQKLDAKVQITALDQNTSVTLKNQDSNLETAAVKVLLRPKKTGN